MLKYLAIPAAAMLAAMCSCRPEAPAVEPVPDPAISPPPAAPAAFGGMFSKPSPVTSPAAPQGAVMATVNGQPVYMKQLYDVLVRGQGLELGRELIASEIVRQEAQKRGLSAGEEDVQAENRRLSAGFFPSVPEEEQRERLLAQLLAQKGLSRVRWELICLRNALLRKIAEPRVNVTDEMLRSEYAEQFGRKVVVRHIEVESENEAEKVMNELKAKADFATLARRYSKNPSASDGGLLPPMSRTSPAAMHEAIRQVAVSLTEVGEVSDLVRVGYAYHILRLEKIIEPTTVPSEAAKAQLREALRERLIRQTQQQVMLELMGAAKFEFADPGLREMERNSKPDAGP